MIAHHVTAVNYIYRDTRFDGRIEHRNIKFEVQRIKVNKEYADAYYYSNRFHNSTETHDIVLVR